MEISMGADPSQLDSVITELEEMWSSDGDS